MRCFTIAAAAVSSAKAVKGDNVTPLTTINCAFARCTYCEDPTKAFN